MGRKHHEHSFEEKHETTKSLGRRHVHFDEKVEDKKAHFEDEVDSVDDYYEYEYLDETQNDDDDDPDVCSSVHMEKGRHEWNGHGMEMKEVMNEYYRIRLFVNVRFSGCKKVLLKEDVFVNLKSTDTALSIYRRALRKYTCQVGRYIVRHDKSVLVVGKKDSCKVSLNEKLANLMDIKPVRVVFCVTPNMEVIRELESRKRYLVRCNVQADGEEECIWERDVKIEIDGKQELETVWRKLQDYRGIEGATAVAVLTRRREDGGWVRFGLTDMVADACMTGKGKVVFLLGDAALHGHCEASATRKRRHSLPHTHHHRQVQHDVEMPMDFEEGCCKKATMCDRFKRLFRK